jgi:HD-GYP domain-containing protein (c-di-GMP phosphodiesterase class II)
LKPGQPIQFLSIHHDDFPYWTVTERDILPRKSDRASKVSAPETIAIRPDALKIGMYVDLNCSWFKHPFPRRSFRISTQNQIKTIRGLGLDTILVYPRESDPDTTTDAPSLPQEKSEPILEPEPAKMLSEEAYSSADEDVPTAGDYQCAAELASEAYHLVIQRSSQMMRDLSSGSPEGLRNAKMMINGLSTLLTNTEAAGMVASAFDPGDLDNLSVLHSLNVATLSMMVAKDFAIDADSVQLIGMAGLLLDIGEQRISTRIVRNRNHLSHRDTREYHLHPYHAIDMLRRYPGFPEEVLDIIRSHHERLDGSGYPEKLKGDQIPLWVRIVSAVDHYDSLINHPDLAEAVCPAEALSKMYKHEQHLFAPEVVVAMIQTFGVYPPGTVVALSDGSLALVLNINFEVRLKPLVLVYAPGSPADSPSTVDLSLESSLTIVRAISRANLPPALAEYFHIKRWTGYFIQSSMRTAREETAK